MNEEQLDQREAQLAARLARLGELESQVLRREKALKEKEKAKKQVLLRLRSSTKPMFCNSKHGLLACNGSES